MMPDISRWAIAVIATVGTLTPLVAQGATVGNIEVCYFCGANSGGFPTFQDGPIFKINDLSATPLTGVTFTANGDTYNIGTVVGNGSVFLTPGISNDGGLHASGAFWQVTGSILDTSDSGPDSNSTQFQLSGLLGGLLATTGIFTPATSIQPLSNDGTAAGINFLGGPGNTDGPCNNCYGPDIVATINTADNVVTPLPGALPLFAGGLGVMSWLLRRRKQKGFACNLPA